MLAEKVARGGLAAVGEGALPEGREKDVAEGLVNKAISEVVPASFLDKAFGYRTAAMLLNPKTLSRNVIGNAAARATMLRAQAANSAAGPKARLCRVF